jgi:AcrR family transcriptional regulator
MPRITAASIEQHLRQQNERVVEAASKLFRQRGFRGTDLSHIAAAVGLARNSLYRYFPSKEHLLVACVQRDMGPFLASVEALEQSHADPRRRIEAWLDLSMDLATGPQHATLELMGEVREASPELRQQILALHRLPNGVLERAVKAVLARQKRDPALVAGMIAAMLQSAAGQALRRPAQAAIRRELKSGVARLLQA